MDITKIINPLNDSQRLAVSAPSQAMLVLAGATPKVTAPRAPLLAVARMVMLAGSKSPALPRAM